MLAPVMLGPAALMQLMASVVVADTAKAGDGSTVDADAGRDAGANDAAAAVNYTGPLSTATADLKQCKEFYF